MSNFKLNIYYEMYKNKPLPSRDEFRRNFKKKYGKFQDLEELIRMIECYQLKRYGQTLNNFIKIPGKEERKKIQHNCVLRERARLGK